MAGALGADAVEVDVRLTADDVPMLIHDARVRPADGAPDRLRTLPFAQVRELRRAADGLPIPTLEEALQALPHDVAMVIDVKEARAARQVVPLAAQLPPGRVRLWARSLSVLQLFARELPEVERALLRDTRRASAMPRYLEDAARCGAHAISPRWRLVTPELVADAHARGLKVFAMAENAESQAAKLAAGLDGVVTDWPEEARAAIDRAG